MAKTYMRRLLQGEAFPPAPREPARCSGCKIVHTPRRPLFEATPLMARKYITCEFCSTTGRSK